MNTRIPADFLILKVHTYPQGGVKKQLSWWMSSTGGLETLVSVSLYVWKGRTSGLLLASSVRAPLICLTSAVRANHTAWTTSVQWWRRWRQSPAIIHNASESDCAKHGHLKCLFSSLLTVASSVRCSGCVFLVSMFVRLSSKNIYQ